ncbi:MAG: RagB/SusD family nutrient uptake outer membrane protein [Bacteroidaceae bacterium]|nr:RagB/SusD family nutrient uptake outer membrane protein [Bacteroidaceae bacterium]
MKTNILKTVALGLLTLGIASCSSDFLDTESKTDTTTGNYFKTETDAARALIGCYDGWQCTVSHGPTFCFLYLSELLSDECYGGTGANDARNSQVVDRFSINEDPSQVDLFNNLWQYYYEAIYRCNELISHENDIAWTSDAIHGQYMGEARALRALCYFDLVRIFENVPLLTAPTSENVPQAAPDSVYAQIVADLKYAAENIPASAYPKSDAANNDGRITPYAAKSLLARVYLFYNGVYGGEPGNLTKAEALQGLEDIINSKEYSLIPLYKNLWYCASTTWEQDASGNWSEVSTYAGDGNAETILSMKFNYTSDYNGNSGGNNAIQMFSIRGGTFKAPYGQGWGGATVPRKMYNSFLNGDQRRDASIINLTAEGIASMDEYKKAIDDQREYTGFFNKKYTARSGYLQGADGSWNLTHYYNDVMAGDFQISQPIDYVVMRYADVLLMAAELGANSAQNYFNQVRERAYTVDNGDGTTSLSSSYVQKNLSKDNILEERRLEFAFEGQRYWDLRRQDADASIAANAIVNSGEAVTTGGNEETVAYNAANITSKRGFMQIPNTQILLSNNVLKQNAGW